MVVVVFDKNDGDNDDWAIWDENDHDFCKIPYCASSGYKPPCNGQNAFLHIIFYVFNASLMKYMLKPVDM